MPKKAAEMGPLEVRQLAEPGLHAVGGVAGLNLQIALPGTKSWILRVTVGSRRREMGLGGYPDVTLSQAREQAREIRRKIGMGIDPLEERRVQKNALRAASVKKATFWEAAQMWHNSKNHEYRNRKHSAQVLSTIRQYACPIIGNMPVDEIALSHIIKVLEPVWLNKTETASRLRGRMESVLSWATVSGFRTGENPARWKGNLDTVLPKPGKISAVKHHRAMAIDEVPSFVKTLRVTDSLSARALEFQILTAARSGEVRGSRWSELDIDNRLWIIPANRTKMQKEHRVPLSSAALLLLERLPRAHQNDIIFAGPRGKPLSDMTLSQLMRRMRANAVPHGFRSTFRDWISERTSYSGEVAEMALAHAISNKVEAAYRRGDLFEKRRNLMEDWCMFCDGNE